MADKDKVIRGLKALERSMQTNQCYACSHEFVDAVNEFGDTILREAVDLLEQTNIVRCKDCIHWDRGHTEECDNSESVCFHNGWCKPDWFCADGERRET